jgi:hypothetical protein
MSKINTAPPQRESTRNARADKDAFAQVEKWMAIIREIRQDQAKN